MTVRARMIDPPSEAAMIALDRLAARSVEMPCVIPGLYPTCWITENELSFPYGSPYKSTKITGYGLIKNHWLSWTVFHGPVDDLDLVLDHLCHIPACWNPFHLDLVTRPVNSSRHLGTREQIDAFVDHVRVAAMAVISPNPR